MKSTTEKHVRETRNETFRELEGCRMAAGRTCAVLEIEGYDWLRFFDQWCPAHLVIYDGESEPVVAFFDN